MLSKKSQKSQDNISDDNSSNEYNYTKYLCTTQYENVDKMLSKKSQKSQDNISDDNSSNEYNHTKYLCTTQYENVDKILSKKSQKYHCEKCDYTSGKQSDYLKHLSTKKHQTVDKILSGDVVDAEWKCLCDKSFRFRQSYYRHRKTCKIYAGELAIDSDDGDIIRAYSESSVLGSILKQQQQLHEQIQQGNLDVANTMMNHMKEIIPLVGNTTNNVHNQNNTFNMSIFLNETCKDAMNIDDFVKTLHFNVEDLLYTAENGYVEGVGKILLRGLDALSVEQRPIHCSDVKREVMYVKKNGVWEKDTTDNEELRKTILLIGRMNVRTLPPWMKANPMYSQADSPLSDVYAQIIVNTLVDCEEVGRKYTTKIIKNVAKRCHIDRKIQKCIGI